MKPGTYVMSPKFIKNDERKLALTRTVRVDKVETGMTENGMRKFAITVELTTSKQKSFGRPIWQAGDTHHRELRKWRFVPVLPV